MNKKEILKKVGGILAELNEQYEYLSQSPDNHNELELELFSANANFLSDHLSILVKLNLSKTPIQQAADPPVAENNNVEEPEEPESEPIPVEEPDIYKLEAEEPVADWKFELEKEPPMTFEFEEKKPDALFDRPLTEEEKRVIDEKTRLKPVVEDDKDYIDFEEETEDDIEEVVADEDEETEENIHVKEVVISERTIAVPVELPKEEPAVPTVNDLLSRNISQATIASQFNLRQTKDLKSLISLNDKLSFVRDLFNGYSLAYSEAIELLNRFDSFEAADNFLKQNYASKNNWGAKQDVADKFYEILNRRFSK
ncbi:hypothetical protein [Daejeonella lutea]|uniref:Uncharacterized protein n=1 Tax=Daejeonella lutea TaxID=572036 RepID=A0A1T5BGE5_9SPHI|nr:hypothetical protein [Daejeonella lutea]SKB46316.1 hypothetical protein SAMN05661099_1560 [Daejeonella lutea]